jgi:hypothetical protein
MVLLRLTGGFWESFFAPKRGGGLSTNRREKSKREYMGIRIWVAGTWVAGVEH